MAAPILPQLSDPAQDHAPAVANANFQAVEHQAVFAMAYLTTTGLTWAYYGGRWGGFAITAGTLTLSASTTNYIVVAIATGVISVSTSITNWNDSANYVRAYKVTTNATVPVPSTGIEDHRGGPKGVQGGAGSSGTSTPFTGGTLTSALNEAPPVTIASSTTPAIFAAAANTINITGATTVTGFDTIASGAFRRVVFAGALQLTYNATSMQNITGANITTAAGDVAEFESLGSGNTKMLSYTRANGQSLAAFAVAFQVACSDRTTALTVATDVANFRVPYAFTLTAVRASLDVASSSGLPTVNIKKNGTTVLSTNLSINASSKTSVGATTPAVISASAFADDDEVTIDVTVAGTGAKALIVTLIGTKP